MHFAFAASSYFGAPCTRVPGRIGTHFCQPEALNIRSTTSRTRHDSKVNSTPQARLAIVGSVPETFPKAILAPGFLPSDISVSVAKAQHAEYCKALQATSLTSIVRLPPNDCNPDSVFVEDPVVIISEKTAFMARVGHPSREGEGVALRKRLNQLGLRISAHPEVRLDGGDVLRMSSFFLVGITERTEWESVGILQRIVEKDFQMHSLFGNCPTVIGVPVESGLHLKSLLTWVGSYGSEDEGFLVAPDTIHGHRIYDSISVKTRSRWKVVWIDEREAHGANVVYVPPLGRRGSVTDPGVVLVQKRCPSAQILIRRHLQDNESQFGYTIVVPVDTDELSKANGALTCLSVLV